MPADPNGCACRAIDAYDCFAIRYGIHSFEFWDDFDGSSEPTQQELVDASGGPCQCGCHYEGDEDWEHTDAG